MQIRKLQTKDASLFKQLRLQALKQVPEAFAASYEEEVRETIDFFESKLSNGEVFYGLFKKDDQLVGIISLSRSKLLKMQHKAAIGSVFIAEEARGQGLGKKLFIYVMEEAQAQGIEQLQLVVAAHNKKAKQLYESIGFQVYGFEKRALKINEKYVDEEYMMKIL
ncbi:GNAT family N-acetyltransferase [Halalkalibacter alkaliphilus]|uniref:GNAT family N-acetyltransferase n=1 Tax=Halalkalibacter alkaliphilus TaxID=2917993 RepID=A0A9X2CVV7_9BACI|nr:GNAT family N-acetyltransferase [Halalkalibacter alkaliphilus]